MKHLIAIFIGLLCIIGIYTLSILSFSSTTALILLSVIIVSLILMLSWGLGNILLLLFTGKDTLDN